MINLDYELSPSWNRRIGDVDLRAADEMTLRYECFLGDVVFVVQGADFSARWGWVPVLDFALSLRSIAGALVAEPQQTFEFSESDATIHFRRESGEVTLEASYARAVATVPLVELSLQVERFSARVIEKLEREHPGLADNAFISALSRRLTLYN